MLFMFFIWDVHAYMHNLQIYNKNLIELLSGCEIVFVIFVEIFFQMLEDFRLKIFLTVAEEGGFTRAASVLGITQPSVSQNIAELEKKVGTRLFERLRSDVVLTPAGRIFKDYAESIQAEYALSCQILARFPDTVVRISASEEVFDYLVGDLLSDFLLVHSELTLERAFIGDYDLKVTLVPDKEKRGMFALSYHPSSYFAATRLWRVLSQCFKPAL